MWNVVFLEGELTSLEKQMSSVQQTYYTVIQGKIAELMITLNFIFVNLTCINSTAQLKTEFIEY